MQQWEYMHIVARILPGYLDKWEIHSSVHSLSGEGSGNFYQMLFQMGASGWEIMSLHERVRDSDGATITTFWLKRPKQIQTTSPSISELECRIVNYAATNLEGKFILRKLHQAFKEEVTYEELRALSDAWKKQNMLTHSTPRRLSSDLIAVCQKI